MGRNLVGKYASAAGRTWSFGRPLKIRRRWFDKCSENREDQLVLPFDEFTPWRIDRIRAVEAHFRTIGHRITFSQRRCERERRIVAFTVFDADYQSDKNSVIQSLEIYEQVGDFIQHRDLDSIEAHRFLQHSVNEVPIHQDVEEALSDGCCRSIRLDIIRGRLLTPSDRTYAWLNRAYIGSTFSNFYFKRLSDGSLIQLTFHTDGGIECHG